MKPSGEPMITSSADEWLHSIFSGITDPLCILDEDLIIRSITNQFLSLFQVKEVDVINQPIDLAIPWKGTLKQVPAATRRVLHLLESYVEFRFSIPGNLGIDEKFLLIITPIRRDEGITPGKATGVLIKAEKISVRSVLPENQIHCIALANLIHEITVLDQGIHPGRLIQQVVSRIGPIIRVPFISFLEFHELAEGGMTQGESALWSLRYGFLIGEEWSKISDDGITELQNFWENLFTNHPRHITVSEAPRTIRETMLQREVSNLLLIPTIHEGTMHGCFMLWSLNRTWSENEITSLETIGWIIGAGMRRTRVESDLARSEEKFRGVIEHIGDMYYLTDKAGALLEISPSMATALGYPSPDLLTGMSMESLLTNPDIWPIFLSDVLNGNGVKDYELILKGSNGKIIIGSVSCRLVYDDEGALRGIEGVIRDVSRRRQYEQLVQESEWKLEQAQKIAKLGVWSYTTTTKTFKVSPEIFSILVIPADQNVVVLDDLIRLASEPDKRLFLQDFEIAVMKGEEFGFEFRIDLPKESFKHIRIRGQPRIRDGIVTGSFGILQDITERKEVEQHLLRYANQLEQKTLELDAMRTQLLDMNRELDQRVRMRTTQIEELLRQKDEFIMQIGHDLKTPLTPLVAILPYIRKKVTDPELLELLDVSVEDVKSIRKMITTILELAQMNALYSLSDVQQIYLHTTLDQIISDNAYMIHQKSLIIINEIPDDFAVMISPMHLETLIGNLIGNAVKYSYIGGTIAITASEQGESIIIQIKDTGIGIEPGILPRIFDEFFKADSSRHDRDSHGLGLAIVQRIVDIYGGTIKAKSEGAGKGSVFMVNLKKNPQFRKIATGYE